MTNAVTVSAPGTGVVGQSISVNGTITPATDTVFLALSQQNATLPNTIFQAVTPGSGGAYTGVLIVGAPGTYYAWAWDQATGLSAVSGAIVVGSEAGQLIDAVPVPIAGIFGPYVGAPNGIAGLDQNSNISAKTILGTGGVMANASTIANSFTLASGQNALSVGPITVATGVVVRVNPGSVWRIL